jgi:cation diffusion facilitator CzcD-associated flavoprotein CzcO
VITATGFELSAFGDIPFAVDSRPVDWSQTIAWHGAMFTGVPNLVWVFGYIRASWTLRVDLLADLTLRLLDAMDERGATKVIPQLRPRDEGMALKPWIDPQDFNPGYLMRGMHLLPRQGGHAPWRHGNDYWADRDELPAAPLDDGTLHYD